MDFLSMGMSYDYLLAIKHVQSCQARTVIFGQQELCPLKVTERDVFMGIMDKFKNFIGIPEMSITRRC